jgi:HSP20 family protein
MERSLRGRAGEFAWPPLDMEVGDKEVTLRMDVPGMGPEDVDIQVSGNMLIVRGERSEQHTERRKYMDRHERRFGSFTRTVTLPVGVTPGKVDATYDKGVLTIRVPRVAAEPARRVPVKAE